VDLEAGVHGEQAGVEGRVVAVTAEVESTPLGERITAEVYDRIKHDAREVLAPFTAADGTLAAPFAVHAVVARR
jgi:hypothetical protein